MDQVSDSSGKCSGIYAGPRSSAVTGFDHKCISIAAGNRRTADDQFAADLGDPNLTADRTLYRAAAVILDQEAAARVCYRRTLRCIDIMTVQVQCDHLVDLLPCDGHISEHDDGLTVLCTVHRVCQGVIRDIHSTAHDLRGFGDPGGFIFTITGAAGRDRNIHRGSRQVRTRPAGKNISFLLRNIQRDRIALKVIISRIGFAGLQSAAVEIIRDRVNRQFIDDQQFAIITLFARVGDPAGFVNGKGGIRGCVISFRRACLPQLIFHTGNKSFDHTGFCCGGPRLNRAAFFFEYLQFRSG